MGKKNYGKKYGRPALGLAIGAGTALAGSYLLCRIRERQDTETSLSRLEQMLAQIMAAGEAK